MRISLDNIFMLCRHPRLCYLLECLSAQTSFSIRNSRILNTEWVDWNTLKRSHRRGAEVAEFKIFFPIGRRRLEKNNLSQFPIHLVFFCLFLVPIAQCLVPCYFWSAFQARAFYQFAFPDSNPAALPMQRPVAIILT